MQVHSYSRVLGISSLTAWRPSDGLLMSWIECRRDQFDPTSTRSAGAVGSSAMNDGPNDWRSDPFSNEHMMAALEAVIMSDDRITNHIDGAAIDDAISLAECVAAFHATTIEGKIVLFPDLLAAALSYFPGSAFADRAGTDLFIEEVRGHWNCCQNAATAENTSKLPPQTVDFSDDNPLLSQPFRDEEHAQPVWDAVYKDDERLIAHITGTPTREGEMVDRDAFSLAQVVGAFHATAQRDPHGMIADQLTAMISHFPEGAYATRAGSDLLRDDVQSLWQECTTAFTAKSKQQQDEAAEQAGWLTISDAPWDPDTLPPRPWLARPYLMRGEITLLHGPGGGGKSQLLAAYAVALALGQRFGRLEPQQRSRVLLANFEDNATEQERRISAALRYFDATPADLKGWLFRVSLGPKGDATMFELDEHGAVRPTACWHALEHACETIQPDAVFLDPLVAINAVPESNNTLMRRVMTFLLMGMARRFDCVLAVAHHDNKNSADDDDGDQGNARGAGDIVNAVRFELAVKKMTVGQADQMGIEHDRRGFYFRLGSAASKTNYAAPEESEWFERLAVVINGEAVVRCFPWDPPSARLTDEMAACLIAAIGDGTPHGPYSPQLGKGKRSLGPLLEEHGIKGAAPQRRAMHELTSRHGVVQAAWKIPGRGADRSKGLRTAGRSPSNWGWLDDEGEGP